MLFLVAAPRARSNEKALSVLTKESYIPRESSALSICPSPLSYLDFRDPGGLLRQQRWVAATLFGASQFCFAHVAKPQSQATFQQQHNMFIKNIFRKKSGSDGESLTHPETMQERAVVSPPEVISSTPLGEIRDGMRIPSHSSTSSTLTMFQHLTIGTREISERRPS
jgi:hypothetical protein